MEVISHLPVNKSMHILKALTWMAQADLLSKAKLHQPWRVLG